jgi:hypothetical protein
MEQQVSKEAMPKAKSEVIQKPAKRSKHQRVSMMETSSRNR